MAKRKTLEEFVQEAKCTHGVTYDYSASIYVNSSTPITIICPAHGEFQQRPGDHLAGKGCYMCGRESIGRKSRNTAINFINKARLVHNDKYEYSKVYYETSLDPVTITCPEHGDFIQKPKVHLKGSGCQKCGKIVADNSHRDSTEMFIKKANKVHHNAYSYNNIVYKFNKTPITITCKVHGDFSQVPNNHLQGAGCPSCAACGFDRNKPGKLYYLDLGNGLYKIGVTNRDVRKRFSFTDRLKINRYYQWEFTIGEECYQIEQRILKDYKDSLYKGPDILQSGNTEIFTIDIYNDILKNYLHTVEDKEES